MSSSPDPAVLRNLKHGYAQLLGVDVTALDRPGFTLVETALRDRPEWANWILPLWLFSLGPAVVCSVAPRYSARARAAFGERPPTALLTPDTLARARAAIDVSPSPELEWVQTELLYYPYIAPPMQSARHEVEQLRPGPAGDPRLLRTFDGGVFVVRLPDGALAAHAAIKNKGILQELAVGTDERYRRQGMGKAVVSQATAHIVTAGQVAVYWPDSLDNRASLALAASVGFQPVARMCFCCYPEAGWPGFDVPS